MNKLKQSSRINININDTTGRGGGAGGIMQKNGSYEAGSYCTSF